MAKKKEYTYVHCFFEREHGVWKAWTADAPHNLIPKWYRVKIPIPDELLLDEIEAEEPIPVPQN